MTTQTLSPKELEIIQELRAKEAAEAQAKLDKEQKRIDQEIANHESDIKKNLAEDIEQIAAAQKFASELGSDYKLQYREWDRTYTVYSKQGWIEEELRESCIVWTKTVSYKRADIVRDSNHTVYVDEHVSYGPGFYGKRKSHGYKMRPSFPDCYSKIGNRSYSRAAKVNELINESINKIAYDKKQKEAQKNAVETTLATIKEKYPNATVTQDQGHEKAPYKKDNWITYDRVTIAFENGYTMVYRIYSDGSMKLLNLSCHNDQNKANWSAIDAISKIIL
jgi:uncharacterized protein YdhG (YjbR/CyaY superfamily)